VSREPGTHSDKAKGHLKPDETSFKWNPLTHPKGLGNLPPTFIMTAGFDPSRDDNLIGEKMMREKYNVKTRLNLYQGATHIFWINFPDLDITKRWAQDRREGIKWLLAGGQ
jgi:acetyl esterase/lipase